MMMIRTTLIFILTSCVVSLVNGQKYSHEKLISGIDDLLKVDSKERVWCKKDKNLIMFDNTEHNYEVKPLKDSELFEDEEGNIWGTNATGYFCFKNDKLEKYPYSNELLKYTKIISVFSDSDNRTWLVNEAKPFGDHEPKRYITIFEKDTFFHLTKKLPKKIERIEEYKNGYVFGYEFNYKYQRPCGYYDGEYKLLEEGEIFDFFNSMKSVLTQDWLVPENIIELFEKYTYTKVDITSQGNSAVILLLTSNSVVCTFFSGDGPTVHEQKYIETKEYSISPDYKKYMDDITNMYYIDNTVYLVTFNKGILEISESNSLLHTKKNNLSDNNIENIFLDNSGNLVVMHPSSSSVLLNGEWNLFTKDNGYELKGFNKYKDLEINDNRYFVFSRSNTTIKPLIMLQWDGIKWTTIQGETAYSYVRPPFVFNKDIWSPNFSNSFGGDGMIYYDGNEFVEYSLGDDSKNVSKSIVTHKAIYMEAGKASNASLFKITKK